MPCCLIRPSSIHALVALTFVTVISLAIDGYQCAAQPPSAAGNAKSARREDGGVSTSRQAAPTGLSSRELRAAAIASLPLSRLTPAAQQRISAIVERPTLFRHLPTQTIECDPELFIFIARNPEVLVGIWEVMGITQVRTERIDDFRMKAHDGSGTNCTVDLVYGDRATHVYVTEGYYDGKLVAAPITGKGVFILRTRYETRSDGLVIIDGTLDCFVQLDNLGADLIARTLGPLIGKSADNNFAETAKFIDQIGRTARTNPEGFQDLACTLPQVSEANRLKFVQVIADADRRNQARLELHPPSRSADSSNLDFMLR
jgi:hypothetical protein